MLNEPMSSRKLSRYWVPIGLGRSSGPFGSVSVKTSVGQPAAR